MKLENLNGITKKTLQNLERLKIKTIIDLLTHFPRNYEDRRYCKKFLALLSNKDVNYPVEIKVLDYEYFMSHFGKTLKIIVSDGQNKAKLICFNRNYLKEQLIKNKSYILFGDFEYKYGEIQAAKFEFIEKEQSLLVNSLDFLRIVPIYPLSKGIKQSFLREIIYENLLNTTFSESLPESIIEKHQLISKKESFFAIHFPENYDQLEKARYRLKYFELFELEISVALKRKLLTRKRKKSYSKKQALFEKVLNSLPFKLTDGQKNALKEIKNDLNSKYPMHRMLQGDVASGKTIIALLSMLIAIDSGYQCSLMCPREILARQHHKNFSNFLKNYPVRVALLSGQMKSTHKRELFYLIREGFYNIIIGTQSLFSEGVEYKKLGMIVIDEQHKFGVEERMKLTQKGNIPDILLMSATPIPRTLSLTVYGDLDMSIIRDKPKSKTKIKSYGIFNQEKRNKMYQFIDKHLEKKRQAFIVSPTINSLNKLNLNSAEKLLIEIKKKLPNRSISLLHSRLSSIEKDNIMKNFLKGNSDILIATSIIEVGLDIPNATIMVIESANYFGLSQLHQLRGRVGRGFYESFCFFCATEKMTDNAKHRLKALLSHNDGFSLAEKDLTIRGPGEFLGIKQSGLEHLKIANITKDESILKLAKQDAFELVNNDTYFEKPENEILQKGVFQRFMKTYQFYLRT